MSRRKVVLAPGTPPSQRSLVGDPRQREIVTGATPDGHRAAVPLSRLLFGSGESGSVDTAADGNLTDQRGDWIAVRLTDDLTIVANTACALSRARAARAAA